MFFDSVLEELDQKRTVLTVESVKYNLNLFFACTYNFKAFFSRILIFWIWIVYRSGLRKNVRSGSGQKGPRSELLAKIAK